MQPWVDLTRAEDVAGPDQSGCTHNALRLAAGPLSGVRGGAADRDSSTTDLREMFRKRRVLLRDGIEMATSSLATATPTR